MASETTRAMTESSPPSEAICSPCSIGSAPSAATIFSRALVSAPSGRCSPMRSMAATSALASTGSRRAGRAKLSE